MTNLHPQENVLREILFRRAQISDEEARRKIFVDAPTSH
jgi:hypothetical protein